MTSRAIIQALNEYQAARLRFVQTVSDLASRPHHIDVLESVGTLELLQPLISDVVPTIQQTAVAALGKLANSSEKMAIAVVRKNYLDQLLSRNIEKQNKFFKKALLFLLRTVAKHSPELAATVVENNGLSAIVVCLEDFETGVKESAAWAIGYITRHNKKLAQTAVDAGVVPLLALCLQEPGVYLKQISSSALCDISKHSPELAQAVVDAGVIPLLAQILGNPDVKLKRQVFCLLGSIAKHSVSLAESVVEADIFPEVLHEMSHDDEIIRRSAAILTREICKHSEELAELVVHHGGIATLIQLISASTSTPRAPAIMALGFICGHSGPMAMAALEFNAADVLSSILNQENDDHMLAIAVWALGEAGKHSPDHSIAVTSTNVLPKFIQFYCSEKSSEDLKDKTEAALKNLLENCHDVEVLGPLVVDAPPEILKYVLEQFTKILPHDPRARRLFVTTGGLEKIQLIQADVNSRVSEHIKMINSCFPEEIVRYFSPGYTEKLLDIVEKYQPERISKIETATSSSSRRSTQNSSINYKKFNRKHS